VELAKTLGIDQSNVSSIERGVRGLTVHQVLKLARALGVSTDEVLSGTAARDNGPMDRRFLRRLRKVDMLSKRQQDALLLTIDTFLKASGSR
jgi:transcriptional regulator with XRE-family HTH domain